jgi:hypothetical protein
VDLEWVVGLEAEWSQAQAGRGLVVLVALVLRVVHLEPSVDLVRLAVELAVRGLEACKSLNQKTI